MKYKDQEEYNKWLQAVQVGDAVCMHFYRNGSCDDYCFFVVAKLTKKQIVCHAKDNPSNEKRFNRDSGREIGRDNYARVEEATREVYQEVHRQNLARHVGAFAERIERSRYKLSVQELEQLNVVLLPIYQRLKEGDKSEKR